MRRPNSWKPWKKTPGAVSRHIPKRAKYRSPSRERARNAPPKKTSKSWQRAGDSGKKIGPRGCSRTVPNPADSGRWAPCDASFRVETCPNNVRLFWLPSPGPSHFMCMHMMHVYIHLGLPHNRNAPSSSWSHLNCQCRFQTSLPPPVPNH